MCKSVNAKKDKMILPVPTKTFLQLRPDTAMLCILQASHTQSMRQAGPGLLYISMSICLCLCASPLITWTINTSHALFPCNFTSY